MFSPQLKLIIAEKIQKILRETKHHELPPTNEIQFILHVDGAEGWSWANIRNNNALRHEKLPTDLNGNLTWLKSKTSD